MENIILQLSRIRTDQFAVYEDTLASHPSDQVSVKGELFLSHNYQERTVIISVQNDFSIAEEHLITIKVTCFFCINEESWSSLLKNNKVIIPKNILTQLGGIVVSTTRGVLHAKTEGTDFNKFLMPIIDVGEIIKSDMIIDVPSE